MAAVTANAKGQFCIQWRRDGRRPTIYLGKVLPAFAEEFGRRVDLLVQAQDFSHPPDPVTLAWLAGLSPKLQQALAEKGLCAFRDSPAKTLAELCRYCIEQATDIQPSSLQKYRDTEANLLAFFPSHTSTAAISPGDADEFAKWLLLNGKRPSGPLSPTTASKRIEQARQFFSVAVRKRWLDENPFVGVTVTATSDNDRQFYVTREATQLLMDAATPELRLMIALARFGGLRVPSEIWPLELTWINQAESVLKVLSPKNRRYEHKKWRFVPLFPEIRVLLTEAFEAAPEGATLLFPNQGITATALRNRLSRLCNDCGMVPWPKLWQNMRSTRETELIDAGYPIHVVCQWLNNSPAVAIRHYFQVAKDHVQRAVDNEMTEKPPLGEISKSNSLPPALTRAIHTPDDSQPQSGNG
jgi:site-specific recombinase XerD